MVSCVGAKDSGVRGCLINVALRCAYFVEMRERGGSLEESRPKPRDEFIKMRDGWGMGTKMPKGPPIWHEQLPEARRSKNEEDTALVTTGKDSLVADASISYHAFNVWLRHSSDGENCIRITQRFDMITSMCQRLLFSQIQLICDRRHNRTTVHNKIGAFLIGQTAIAPGAGLMLSDIARYILMWCERHNIHDVGLE